MTKHISPDCFKIQLSDSIDESPLMGKSMTEEVRRNGERAKKSPKLSDEEIFFEEKPRAGRRHYQVGTEE